MSVHEPSWFYSINGGAPVGPVTLAHLQQLIASGHIAHHHSVRHDSWPRWCSIAEAATQLGLNQVSPQAPPPPPDGAAPPPPRPVGAAPPPGVPLPPGVPPPPGAAPPPPGSTHAAARRLAPTPVSSSGDVSAPMRVASWGIDAVVVAVAVLLLNSVLPSVIATLFAFAAFCGYVIVLPMKGFSTLGHVLIGLRLVRSDQEAQLDWLAVGTRAALLVILAAPCFVGLVFSTISMWAHDKARAWHDVATGTHLIRVKPGDFGRHSAVTTIPTPSVGGQP